MNKYSKIYVNPLLRRVGTSGNIKFYLEDKEGVCFELDSKVLTLLDSCRTPVPISSVLDTSTLEWRDIVDRLLDLSILRSENQEKSNISLRRERLYDTAFATDHLCSYEKFEGAIVILGACTDAGTLPQYPRGAILGPEEIRRASQSFPLRERLTNGEAYGWYDFETNQFLLQGAQILDGGDVIHRPGVELIRYLEELCHILEEIRYGGGRFVILGGDHSISMASIQALHSNNIGVIHFDAHSDLGYISNAADINHGNIVRHILSCEHVKHVVTIGLRGIQVNKPTEEKHDFYSISQVRALKKSELASILRDNLVYYITVDIDVLDPSIAPATAAPTPDGMSLRELRMLIRELSNNRTIIGADIVEVQSAVGCQSTTTAISAVEIVIELMHSISLSNNVSIA